MSSNLADAGERVVADRPVPLSPIWAALSGPRYALQLRRIYAVSRVKCEKHIGAPEKSSREKAAATRACAVLRYASFSNKREDANYARGIAVFDTRAKEEYPANSPRTASSHLLFKFRGSPCNFDRRHDFILRSTRLRRRERERGEKREERGPATEVLVRCSLK